jgi:hypothetical protein
MPFKQSKWLPEQLPPSWRLLAEARDGAAYIRADGLIIVASTVRPNGDQRWLHISCSRDWHPPTLADLQAVKSVFIGHEATAFQVLPPRDEKSDAPHCMHLWVCLDDIPFPSVLHQKRERAA